MSNIIHIHKCDSTNNFLKQLLTQSRPKELTIIMTDFQSAGKGQKGNSWESEAGKNLLFSIILYPHMIKANRQFIISQLISLAVAETLSDYTAGITIKWPNDIYWNEKKICGILIENTLNGDRLEESVAGIGININQEKFYSNAPNPISLKQITGKDYDLNEILLSVKENITAYYSEIKKGQSSKIIDAYKTNLFRKQCYHLYNDGENNFFAKIKDIEPTGILVLETKEGTVRKFAFKEIKYLLS